MDLEFGCFYNPRVGRCIKDPSYKTVDKECEVVDSKCQLKKKDVINKSNGKISGPISAYMTEFEGKI